MRFSLQEVKKKVQRRDGSLSVVLHFLRPGEIHAAIERLLNYHEGMLGQPHRLFSLDEARACIGDYRLADCLIATLSYWYNWRPREWASALRELDAPQQLVQQQGASEICAASPVQLRLALYDYVNEHYQGFLSDQDSEQALQSFAQCYGLRTADLEYLLALDNEGEALLVRDVVSVPQAADVATLYNQWVFEAALFNASSVRFVIDCRAFAVSVGIGTGVGAAIKRLVFLARKLGVYYDLAYEGVTSDQLTLTLYGPQEVSGAPQQYGLRLARLCRLLLGYGSPQIERTRKRSAFASAIIAAEATIHFLQRSYQFSLDAHLLRLFPVEAEDGPAEASSVAVFDSGVEQSFGEAFLSLAGRQGLDGWSLEREPEPLLLDRYIVIPDFAVTRGQRRIYVEILGFWTPSYRERKIERLQQLRERTDLLLAIPNEAKAAFASVTPYFPVLYYEGKLAISDLLHMLRSRYDDFSERLANLDIVAVQARVQCEQHLAEQACYEVLNCYRRTEVEHAASLIVNTDIAYHAGLGLYMHTWMIQLKQSFIAWLRAHGSCALAEAERGLKQSVGAGLEVDAAFLETLLALWPEVRLRRASIFEVIVELAEGSQSTDEPEPQSVPPSDEAVKRQLRERRSPKKRLPQQAQQGDLWGE